MMPTSVVKDVDGADEGRLRYGGVPERLVSPVLAWRRRRDDSRIVAVLTRDKTPEGWARLGKGMVDAWRSSASVVGLDANGSLPSAAIARVWQALDADASLACLSLRWGRLPLPIESRGSVVDLTWTLVQRAPIGDWLRDLWEDLPSAWFNHGADLVVTFHRGQSVPWGTDFTVDSLLVAADDWVTPLDGNLGFLVGVSSDSPLRSYIETPGEPVR